MYPYKGYEPIILVAWYCTFLGLVNYTCIYGVCFLFNIQQKSEYSKYLISVITRSVGQTSCQNISSDLNGTHNQSGACQFGGMYNVQIVKAMKGMH